ncbi:hypothetical protein NX862_01975 [Rhodobacter sp. KR11]|uniref:hypothetical protein n=1 Tax=Rhodobacter sp. KR11 TaxID=2974588 RepID=UPI0022228AF8|nr:hypothetical protein [Rhodobacter sp. KR11]MCW1917513.1 hypothetical protein [Rhodobacter sp. KR11]
MQGRIGRALALAALASLGAGLIAVALLLGLSRLIGPVAAFALLGGLCLAVVALVQALQPRPTPRPAGAELVTLLAVLALRGILRRR